MKFIPIRRRTYTCDGQLSVEQAINMKGLHRFIPMRRRSAGGGAHVVVEDLSEKLLPIIGTVKFATVIHNLFTPEECADLIAISEEKGYDEALVHGSSGGEVLRKDIRDCGRCIVDDMELSSAWFHRIMQALEVYPEVKEKITNARHVGSQSSGNKSKMKVCGLNERLRYLRYLPGQYFAPHQDNSFTRGPESGERCGQRSCLTFLLYLNKDVKGGETRFESGGRILDVAPKVGSVLIFDHDICHRAMPIVSGKKYCCRSDLMYTTSLVHKHSSY
mmetsp:Transcript_26390/g.45035  ORF Transcript_26390/g.45035 Transcript_26390/m.45035 type:complete len:275 (+) Transcript_26390:86-910(+)